MKNATKKFDQKHLIIERWFNSITTNAVEPKPIVSKSQKLKFHILLSNPDFLLKVRALRKMLGLPIKYNEAQKHKSRIEKLYQNYNITTLLQDFKVSDRWRNAIEHYVIFNKISEHLFPPDIIYGVYNDRQSILITTNRNTTLEDIKRIWKDIEQLKSFLYVFNGAHKTPNGIIFTPQNGKLTEVNLFKTKRKMNMTEFNKYKKAYELRGRGVKCKPIAEQLGIGKGNYPRVGIFINRFKRIIRENELY